MSLWALGNILCVNPLQFAYGVQPCSCISVMDGASCIFCSSIFYLTFFMGGVFVATFLAGCSCMNVWYGAPVPESYFDAVARAFIAMVFAVWIVSLFFGMSTLIAPRA